MGFGYLAIGYLVTFILYIPAYGLGVGGLALLIGYGIMFLGLCRLQAFHRSFSIAKWVQIPLIVTALYTSVRSLATLFWWNIPLFDHALLNSVIEWSEFALQTFFNFAVLYAIREIAKEVELPRISSAALRNMIFVCGYGILYIIGKMNIAQTGGYLNLSITIVKLVWILCNLFLMITCAKDICSAEDEDQAPKRYRWELLNRIGDAYERNHTRAINKVMEETEERLRKKQEARNQKKIHHNKRKKKK